jgi:glycosyltransferase involved in cell wall biosynthesis
MKLVVLSVCYNREKFIYKSVSSLFNSVSKNDLVVLVNDGSDDSTFHELKRFDGFENSLIIDKDNEGFTKTLSKVIPFIIDTYNPEYIAVHGIGDVCYKNKYYDQVSYLDDNKDVVAVGCGHKLISQNTGALLDIVSGYSEASTVSLLKQTPFTHGTVVYRTSAYIAVGGYDSFFKCCQDWELYTRLIEKGRIVRIDNVSYEKYIFPDGVSYNPLKKIEQMVYKDIAVSSLIDQSGRIVSQLNLEKNGINSFFRDEKYLYKFNQTQIALIRQGEFLLALKWCEVISDIYNGNTRKQKSIAFFLRILIVMQLDKVAASLYVYFKRKFKS